MNIDLEDIYYHEENEGLDLFLHGENLSCLKYVAENLATNLKARPSMTHEARL